MKSDININSNYKYSNDSALLNGTGNEEDFLNPNEFSKMKFMEMDCS